MHNNILDNWIALQFSILKSCNTTSLKREIMKIMFISILISIETLVNKSTTFQKNKTNKKNAMPMMHWNAYV